ncbi:MAG: tetratricopeptide repeat-containing glycosyltransferase [Chloroflexota bacterium]
MARQTICLNMIVKDEAPVIRRCLDSLRAIIDYWVIVDTGSTDATMEIIRETLNDVPGELYQEPWVDFAHNRTQALEFARGGATGRPRCDYILLIDADDVVELAENFTMPRLEMDAYLVEIRYGNIVYPSKRLVRGALPWRYIGVLHEYIHCDVPTTEGILHGFRDIPTHDGARARDPLTYRRDALVLEKALLDEPGNARYVFYLAQTYRDAGDPELAIRYYKRRVEMGEWAEEVWYSLYQIAAIKERMGKAWDEVLQDYLAAYQYRADRAEPLYRIGMHYQAKREFHLAYLFLGRAMQLPIPTGNRLFIEQAAYDYLIPLEFAVACYWLGYHAEAIATNNRLLNHGALPPHLVETVTKNLQFSLETPARSEIVG